MVGSKVYYGFNEFEGDVDAMREDDYEGNRGREQDEVDEHMVRDLILHHDE